MKKDNTFVTWIVFIVILVGAVTAIKPFWDRYWLKEEMERAAAYGTKNSIEQTRQFLTKRMNEEGYDLSGEDFNIQKDRKSNVTISVTYDDEMALFGLRLKDLNFAVRVFVRNIPSVF
jgi:hypothetical protein